MDNRDCPFCRFVAGEDSPFNARSDIVHDDDEVMAFISPRWIGDDLYRNTNRHRFAPIDRRRPYAERLRSFLDADPTAG
jgi:hypothetical protein